MTLQWAIVIGVNLAIILYGLWASRETRTATDWFLAAKGLPWWMVGLSMFATAVDSGDYVAVAGKAFESGMSYMSAWWLGLTVGWLLVAYFVFVPVYRTGMFTNSEYLEHRFGPTSRLISVFIQVQYRTNVLGNVAYSLFVTLTIVADFTPTQAWTLVAFIALAAAIYTATGGVRSVALTDSLQSIVMLAAALVIWFKVKQAAGTWEQVSERLERAREGLSDALLHVGGYQDPSGDPIPALIVVLGWIIALSAYCVVNHSQSMRMLSARSEWDMKMAALVAAAVTAAVMWFNVSIGVLGRSLMPTLERPDLVFPTLVKNFLEDPWLVGIVLAGLLAGGISTFDSVGSAVAAVFTRDFYARFVKSDGDDRHYLWVSRIATFFVIGLSFLYVPFLKKEGMVNLYLKLTGVAAIPLFAVYIMGVLTPANRRSGSIGLLVGIAVGMTRFLPNLPYWWTNSYFGYLWSVGVTAAAMAVTSFIMGWESREWLAGLTTATADRRMQSHIKREAGWLHDSRQTVPDATPIPANAPWYRRTWPWALIVLATIATLNLLAFW